MQTLIRNSPTKTRSTGSDPFPQGSRPPAKDAGSTQETRPIEEEKCSLESDPDITQLQFQRRSHESARKPRLNTPDKQKDDNNQQDQT